MGRSPRLVRQKRRLYLFGVLAALAAMLRLGPSFDAIFLTFVALAIALVTLKLLYPYRQALESAGIGLLIAAPVPVSADIYFALVLVVAAGAYHLLHGSWSARSDLRFALASERTAMSDLPRDAVWQRVVPGSGHPDDFWTGNLVDFDSDPDDPLTLYVRYREDSGLFSEATVTFLDLDPPRSCRFMIEPETVAYAEDKVTQVTLTEAGEKATIIDSRVEVSDMSLRIAAAYWFDDSLGDDWEGLAITSHRAQKWFPTWPTLAARLSRRATEEVREDETPVAPRPAEDLPEAGPRNRAARDARALAESDFREDFDILSVLEPTDGKTA